ncbi:MAG: hypothetical protein LBP42_04515 [Treponema sp.]|jgi:hypothetical protein|nr:hypothetical protein [Treponema sp.]
MSKTNQKEDETKHSLKIQFTLFFVFFVAALYAVIIITTVQQLKGITEAISEQLGVPIVREAATLIDGDAFERLSASLDPADPYYDETRLRMLALKEKSQCLYLYTMAPVPGSQNMYRYIIDGSAPPEDEENFSPLGAMEDISIYSQYVAKSMETQTIQTSSIDYTPAWGWVITTYAPIVNSSGVSVGFVGCDFKAENVYEQLWLRIFRQLAASAVFVLLGFIAYLYMVNGVNKQNARLLALKEAAEDFSRKLQEERDTINAMKDALKVGLFLMDKNFVIQAHYSKHLETVLDVSNLEGKKFTDLIAASISQKELSGLVEYFVLLFNRSLINNRKVSSKLIEDINPIQELIYISPKDRSEKILQWTFAPLDQGNGKLFILGNIQDITGEKSLERLLSAEEQKRKEEVNALFTLLRSDANIIKELEKMKEEKNTFTVLIDKILSV